MTDQLKAALKACRVPCPYGCAEKEELRSRQTNFNINACWCCGGTNMILPPAVLAALRAVAETAAEKCDEEERRVLKILEDPRAKDDPASADGWRSRAAGANTLAAFIRDLKESIK